MASGKRKARDYGDRCVRLSIRLAHPRPFHAYSLATSPADPGYILCVSLSLTGSYRQGMAPICTLLIPCLARATARRAVQSDPRDENEARASSSTVRGVRAGPPSAAGSFKD